MQEVFRYNQRPIAARIAVSCQEITVRQQNNNSGREVSRALSVVPSIRDASPLWRHRRLAIAVAAFVAAPWPVHAQSTGATLAECREIASDRDRLACFDRMTGRAAGAPSSAAPSATSSATPSAPELAAAGTAPAKAATSILGTSWGLDPGSDRYAIGFYNSNYLLPVRYTERVNNRPFSPLFAAAGIPSQTLDDFEAKFQLSFKARLWSTDDRRWSLWGAYSQQNQWQVYNDGISRPFRETNYKPEIFATYRPDLTFAGLDLKVLHAGYTHQSNGRTDPLSRSWDRLFVEAGLENGNFAMTARAWHRIKESAAKDDNPDITDYLGYGELNALYRWRGNSFGVMGRGNLGTGKGAVQASWFSRPLFGPVRGYVQLFSGYGESMIDYNWNQTTVGIGFALNDGF